MSIACVCCICCMCKITVIFSLICYIYVGYSFYVYMHVYVFPQVSLCGIAQQVMVGYATKW
jgi:hypothetical protein